ncbi:MAG: AraC family transcriptional regulator [Eubacterium sp.]|nr:AraC family transcriptional regulator [Eubacterium sp.]
MQQNYSEEDIHYLVRNLASLAGIPVRIYQENQQTFYFSIVELPVDPIVPWLSSIIRIDRTIGYFTTDDLLHFGILNTSYGKIVCGPTSQTPMSEQEIRHLAFLCNVPKESLTDFMSGMHSLTHLPLLSLIQMLLPMAFILTGKKVSLRDVSIAASVQDDLKAKARKKSADQRFEDDDQPSDNRVEADNAPHNTYRQEQMMLDLVASGDIDSLQKWMENTPAISGGIVGKDQLRQYRNTFVVSAALVSRAAIRGGMTVEEAFSLSDNYIQRCELLSFSDQILNLQYHMVLDYTDRVHSIRHGKNPSRLVLDVTNYVRAHISRPITAEEISDALFISRPYLSRKFKEETGTSITDFVLQQKTEEAKRLLRFTDKSLTMISLYLGFSSPGHFSRVFHKYAGCSPSAYRRYFPVIIAPRP